MSETNTDVRDEGCARGNCCALADILMRVGDKWTVMVVGVLSHGPRRYSEIAKRIGGISQRMLTLTLKGLERDGLVTRTMYPTIPPRVDYELTERGHTLIAPLSALRTWSAQNQQAIDASRREYDSHLKNGK
jgi:DNA-binding HxlR family transcriptional regulator